MKFRVAFLFFIIFIVSVASSTDLNDNFYYLINKQPINIYTGGAVSLPFANLTDFPSSCGAGNYVYGFNESALYCRADSVGYNSLADLQTAVSNDFHNLGGTDIDTANTTEQMRTAVNGTGGLYYNITAQQCVLGGTSSSANDSYVEKIFEKGISDQGLLLYLPFDNSAKDYSFYSNDGISNGNPTWIAGKKGNAIDFDGNADYIDIGLDFPYSTQITACFWTKPSDLTDDRPMGRDNGGTRIWYIGKIGNYWYFVAWNTTGAVANAQSDLKIENDKWVFICGVYNGTNMLLYLNATVQADQSYLGGNLQTGSEELYIGKIGSSPDAGTYNGTIDEVMIWNRSLSQDEINSLYWQSTQLLSKTGYIRNSDTFYVDEESGTVGIGTKNPSNSTFNIVGDTNVTGDLIYGGELITYSPLLLRDDVCLLDHSTGEWVRCGSYDYEFKCQPDNYCKKKAVLLEDQRKYPEKYQDCSVIDTATVCNPTIIQESNIDYWYARLEK